MVKTKKSPKTTKHKSKKVRKNSPAKQHKKKIYSDFRFWIAVACASVLIIVAFIIIASANGDQHEKAVSDYSKAWKAYGESQFSFGYAFGTILGEMGFSSNESNKYNLSSSIQNEMSRKCAQKVGIYDEIYNNPYAVEDKDIASKSTADIQAAIDNLEKFTSKINNAILSVSQCKEIGEAKKAEIDQELAKKAAEEKAKAEEEAAKKKQQQEEQEASAKKVLNYNKFTSQIKEGMSLSAIKNVYTGFDSQCKITSQSGGWVMYTCSPASYSSNYWTATFMFYNNTLQSKAQYGLK